MQSCYTITVLNGSSLNIPTEYLNSSGNIELDLLAEGLNMSSSKEQVSDANEISIDGVLSITIPKTAKNSIVFQRFFDTSTPKFLPTPLECRVMKDHIPLRQRYCFAVIDSDTSKTIDIQLTYSVDHWVAKASQLYIKDVPLEPFTLTRQNIVSSWNDIDSNNPNNPSYFFPPAYYGGTYGNDQASVGDFRPFLNDVAFIRRALCGIGWSIEGTILDNPELRNLGSYVLRDNYAGNDNLEAYKFSAKNVDGFGGIGQNAGDSFLPELEEEYDINNLYSNTQYWYTGAPNLYDIVKLKYKIYVQNEVGNEFPDLKHIRLEIKRTKSNGAIITEVVYDPLKGESYHEGELEYTVLLEPGETITIKPRVKLEGQYNIAYLHFYNEPQQFRYVTNDIIDVSSELDSNITLLDFIKGFLHIFNGKIDTDFERQIVKILPPDRVILNNIDEEGYNLDESDILSDVIVDSKVVYSPSSTIERFQHYKFAGEDDDTFKVNEDYREAFTAKIDLGESYKNKTKERKNPLFNATTLIDINTWDSVTSGNDFIQSVYLPSLHTQKGVVNTKVSKRKLLFQWQRQKSIDTNTTTYNEIVWEREEGDASNVKTVFFPLGYLDLSLHSEVEFSSHPNQPVPFDETLSLSYIDKYNKFYKTHLSDYASPRTLVGFVMDAEEFFTLSYRKRKRFNYNGQTYILKPIEANSDVCTSIAEIIMVGELNSDTICEDGIGDDAEVEDSCANYPQLLITNAPPCQIITLVGNHESIIDNVTFEYRYRNADGTYPSVWTPLPNQGLLNANLCNATGFYEVRANVEYIGDCPNLQVTDYYDPCGNDPEIFFNPYLSGTTGDQCFTATIGGIINSTISSQELFYSINGGVTNPYTEGQEICLTGLVGDIQVCITGTINYDGDCDSSVLETCFTFPIEEANCEATTLVPICVPTANANCFHFDVNGNVAGQIATIEIFYKCGIDGDEFQYIGEEVCCPSGDMYVKVVVQFCNDVCPTYCSEWVQCVSTCTATTAVSVDCCTINLTYTNCTNPIIVWQVADIGSNDWTNISGAISDVLNIFDYFPTENKKYRAQIQCDGCSVLYSSVTEIIHSVNITANGCDISAVISGITCTPINYIWESSIDSGTNWSVVSAGIGLSMITANQDALYRVTVAYGGCQRVSNNLQADCNICDDLNVTIGLQDCCTLEVVITNATSPNYQWQQLIGGSYADIVGETNNTLAFTQNGTYRLCITTVDCTDPIYSNPIIVDYDIEVTGDECTYTANPIGGCTDITYNWQVLNTTNNPSTWDDLGITTQTANFTVNGVVRVVATFGTCIVIEGQAFNVVCDPCDPVIVIGNTDCTINLLTLTGCDNPTFQVQRLVSGTFQDVSGATSLPYSSTQNGTYRVEVTCPCGVFYSNEVLLSCCDTNLEILMTSCILFLQTSSNCGTSANNQWQRSCDNGITWVTVGSGSSYAVNDDCWYRLRRNNGCECISNVIVADCATGCNGAIASNSGTCEVDYTIPCPTGVWAFQRFFNGSWLNVSSGNGTIPTNFQITSNGTYRLTVTCDDGCSYTSGSSTFTNCGSNPCNSSVTLTESNCVLIATVTNCPSPIYTFKLNGNTLQTGSSNSYTAITDGLYTVEVSGCPDCPIVSDNLSIVGCDPSSSCNCTSSIFQTGCGLLISNNSGCDGYNSSWQYSINGVSGWSVVANNVTSYQATNNGFYRLVLTKSGCPNVITNIIQVTCLTTCSPTLSITIIDDGCAIRADWSGCEITPTTAEWNYSTNNGTDCNTCAGWTLQTNQVSTSTSNNGTGTSTIIPDNGSACYRFVLGCCDSGTLINACVYWDEGNCIVEQERIVFQNVDGDAQTNELVGSIYTLKSVVVNGVSYFNGADPFTPETTETFDGFLFETSFRDKINSLNIPDFSIRLATAVERAMISVQTSGADEGLSAVVSYISGQSWDIEYHRWIPNTNTSFNMLQIFTITEFSNNLKVLQGGTQSGGGTETFNGSPDAYSPYFWQPDIAL